jgi:hypothetical protein
MFMNARPRLMSVGWLPSTLPTHRCLLPTDSNNSRQKALRDELALLRRLANGRRIASTRLPTLRRTALEPTGLLKPRRGTDRKAK